MKTRVGIDFGNTIGEVEDEHPALGAYDMIRHLVHKFGDDNVFIISKAKPAMETRIREFLERTDFYNACGGFRRENVLFVVEYEEKAKLVEALGINLFFDDHVKVVTTLVTLPSIERIFWMHTGVREIQRIPKGFRSKISLCNDWGKTMKYFQRIRSTNKESIQR